MPRLMADFLAQVKRYSWNGTVTMQLNGATKEAILITTPPIRRELRGRQMNPGTHSPLNHDQAHHLRFLYKQRRTNWKMEMDKRH